MKRLEGPLSSSLGSLANLTYLDLNGNRLSGASPPEIVNAKLLDFLDLRNNYLNGSIPGNIRQLRRLAYLYLSVNHLSGAIPGLSGLGNLQHLLLHSNYLSGPVPALNGLGNLKYLDLHGNDLSGPLPTSLAGFTKLWYLDLSSNRLTGRCPNLEFLKDLEFVDVSANNFSSEALVLPDLQQLRYAHLSGCQFQGPLRLASEFARMPNLEVLDLSDNRLNGSIPGQLLQHAIHLNLSGNSLSGGIPDVLNTSAWLPWASIDLSHNQLEGPIPSAFGNGQVGRLRLQNNRLSGDITASLCSSNLSLSGLMELQVQGNRFTGKIGPATCANCKDMKILDLSGNPVHLVSDPLSIILGTFVAPLELRLRSIGSTGRLLTSIHPSRADNLVVMRGLQVLDLSQNKMEGHLPQSQIMTDANYVFPDLLVLNLSDNRLTGQVPISFAFMQSLAFLNLFNNQLSGRLPDLPPGLSNSAFFAGNPGLCGPPLEECRSASSDWYETSVFKLVAALVACVLLSATCCLILGCRLRVYSKLHRQDADLIAALQGKDSANLMPLADLQKATSNFAEESQIGLGGFGTVYKGRLNDDTGVAIKKSKSQNFPQDKDRFLNEVKILCRVNHRYLVRLLGCCLANKTALLVFEYVANGTLEEHLRGETIKLTWNQRSGCPRHSGRSCLPAFLCQSSHLPQRRQICQHSFG